jgi:transcription antitermination factor NusG
MLLSVALPPAPEARWFAARVRSQCERRVQDALIAQGINEFLPTFREETRWSDRTKLVDRCLFPGYIFARVASVLPLLRIVGVVQILGCNSDPQSIPDEQIEAVRRVGLSMAEASPSPYVVGEAVTIDHGPLAGVTGVIKRVRGTVRLVVQIELLGRGVSVEIDADTVAKTP